MMYSQVGAPVLVGAVYQFPLESLGWGPANADPLASVEALLEGLHQTGNA